jgi:hypothetical protein
MEQSILKSTKKVLQISEDDESFDLDIITHINSAFSILHDLGVGPEDGFAIEDEYVDWAAYLPDDQIKLSKVKTCVYLRTKLLFDPPATTFHLNAVQEQLKEAEWRLNVNRETTEWVDPLPPSRDSGEEEVIGGFGL